MRFDLLLVVGCACRTHHDSDHPCRLHVNNDIIGTGCHHTIDQHRELPSHVSRGLYCLQRLAPSASPELRVSLFRLLILSVQFTAAVLPRSNFTQHAQTKRGFITAYPSDTSSRKHTSVHNIHTSQRKHIIYIYTHIQGTNTHFWAARVRLMVFMYVGHGWDQTDSYVCVPRVLLACLLFTRRRRVRSLSTLIA